MKASGDFRVETGSVYLRKRNMKSFNSSLFSSALFRKHTDIAVAELETYLDNVAVRGLKLKDPYELLEKARKLMTGKEDEIDDFDTERFRAIIDLYIRTGIQVHSPGYMGRQFSGVIPLAGIFDLVNSILNQPSSFYEAAQLPNVAERIMSDELNKFIGYDPQKFTMVTTSGGSLANLTALLAARNHAFPNVWKKGLAAYPPGSRPAIAVSEDIHYSICRTAGILGIGEDNILKMPVDGNGKICVEKVPGILDDAHKKGFIVFCLVASAGTTSLGAIDSLNELGDIANKRGIWFHVDGAHGASLLVSDLLRHKLSGIEKADSITWDAHKMLFVPSPCSLLFYKDKEKSYGAFQQEASYVFEKHADRYTEFDSAEKNFECTKRPMIMSLWVLWAIYGRALFSEKIEFVCQLCSEAYLLLKKEEDFETIHEPECNILCFRYKPHDFPTYLIPDYQLKIRDEVRENGVFFISKVDIGKETALRVVFMNHQIEPKHFRLLLNEIRQVGQNIINQYQKADFSLNTKERII